MNQFLFNILYSNTSYFWLLSQSTRLSFFGSIVVQTDINIFLQYKNSTAI